MLKNIIFISSVVDLSLLGIDIYALIENQQEDIEKQVSLKAP